MSKLCLSYIPLVCVKCSFLDEFAANGSKLDGLYVPCDNCLTFQTLKRSCDNCAVGLLAGMRKCHCESVVLGLELQFLNMLLHEGGFNG